MDHTVFLNRQSMLFILSIIIAIPDETLNSPVFFLSLIKYGFCLAFQTFLEGIE